MKTVNVERAGEHDRRSAASPRDTSAMWSGVAIVAIVARIASFVVTNHLSRYPWNSLERAGSQLSSTLIGMIPFSIDALAFARRIQWLMLIGMVHS
jgi:hypothetical protein